MLLVREGSLLGKSTLLSVYHKPLTMHELNSCRGRRVACDSGDRDFSPRPDSSVRESVGYVTRLNAANNNATAAAVTNAAPRTKRGASK